MAFEKTLFANRVINDLMESKGIFNLCNRSYDSLVQEGATSVYRPKLASLVVRKNTGASPDDASRKHVKRDTDTVITALDTYATGIASEIAGQFETNSALQDAYIPRMAEALRSQFDTDVITLASATPYAYETALTQLGWDDLVGIPKEHYAKYAIPDSGNQIIVVSADLTRQLFAIDVIKQAAAFSMVKFPAGGAYIPVLDQQIFISNKVPKIAGQPAIVAFNGTGLAAILSRFGDTRQVYDPAGLKDVFDVLAHAGFGLDDNKFAMTIKLKK